MWAHLAGDYDHATMVEKGLAATRQLAKRQLTWLRGWPDLYELPADENLIAKNIDKILKFSEKESIY